MHGPWHMPEHPDEGDYSAQERERERHDEESRLTAHARDAELDDFEEEA